MPIDEIPPEIKALPEAFQRLYAELPAIVTREALYRAAPVFRPASLANLDSQGRGIAGRMLVGPKICYPRTNAVLWLVAQTKPV